MLSIFPQVIVKYEREGLTADGKHISAGRKQHAGAFAERERAVDHALIRKPDIPGHPHPVIPLELFPAQEVAHRLENVSFMLNVP